MSDKIKVEYRGATAVIDGKFGRIEKGWTKSVGKADADRLLVQDGFAKVSTRKKTTG